MSAMWRRREWCVGWTRSSRWDAEAQACGLAGVQRLALCREKMAPLLDELRRELERLGREALPASELRERSELHAVAAEAAEPCAGA